MSGLVLLVLFAIDACLVAMTAWLAVRQLAPKSATLLEQLLTWGIAGLSVIAATGVLLGTIGGLHRSGFVVAHVLAFVAFLIIRRGALTGDIKAGLELLTRCRAQFRGPSFETVSLALLIAVVVLFFALALGSQPVVFDALTYRLSRIGHWLQTGRITIIATDDARLNYMPVVPDLIMTWLISGTSTGFQPAAIAQTIGGVLLLGATVALARLSGLGRSASLGAAWLVLGLPNVVPQFTSAYTDLFTAGVLAAGFCLWLSALQRHEGSWLAGIAAGLALGSKGTTAYIAPGLMIAVGWIAWRHRPPARSWWPTLAGAVLATAVVAGPTAWRNFRNFGGPVGPPDFVAWHHGATPGFSGSLQKLRLNLGSAFAQLCEPNSQPPWWRPGVRALGEAVTRRMPESDSFAFDGINRRANLEKVYAVAAPDADVASTGVLLPCLCVAALALAAWQRKSPDAQLILAWSVVVGVFVLFMHWRAQWHPYLFRFVILAVPWMTVVAAWWLGRLPRWPRLAAWTVVAGATAHGLIAGTLNTYQAGWPAATAPCQSTGYYVYQQWRSWSESLDPLVGRLRPHLPINEPLAAFYRHTTARRVEPGRLSTLTAATAQDGVKSNGDGWLIVPAAQFIGREGDVVGKTWLFDGDERNAFSLAAYRALRTGEQPPPVLYRNRPGGAAHPARRELLVRTWNDAPLRIELFNRGRAPRDYEIRSPLGRVSGRLGPSERRPVEVPVPANFPTLLTIDFVASAGDERGTLEAKLLP
jgi:4-amino-4-deoxy-L-arabinose transferase-like glycosyltransferase